MSCPADPKQTLGIKLPFLVMIIKNLKKYFTFEVQVGYNLLCYCAIYESRISCTKIPIRNVDMMFLFTKNLEKYLIK